MSTAREILPGIEPKCGSCRFFVKTCCRRYPPAQGIGCNNGSSSGGLSDVYTYSEWPSVQPEEWCGEWQAASGPEATPDK